MKIGSLFSGYGGLDLAVSAVTGAHTAWFSEIEKAPTRILAHHWPNVPNQGDITAVDWAGVEPVDILTGGFPCQDLSHAGKRAGLRPDTRSGLWSHMAYVIDQLRPSLVVAENVRGLLSAEAHSDVEPCPWCVGDGGSGNPLRALGAVLGDLAELGYDAAWVGLRAADVGAPHGRFRVFIAAWPTTGNANSATGERGRSREASGQSGAGAGEAWSPVRGEFGRAGGAAGNAAGCRFGTVKRDAREGGDEGEVRAADTQPDVLLPTPRAQNGEDRNQTIRERPLDQPQNLENALARDFGEYASAVARWESVIGRPAPAPTEPTGKDGAHRLSPAFVEWMMGLPQGHVTAVPGISRNDQLKALGNGVVPQQAAAALNYLLTLATNEVAA